METAGNYRAFRGNIYFYEQLTPRGGLALFSELLRAFKIEDNLGQRRPEPVQTRLFSFLGHIQDPASFQVVDDRQIVKRAILRGTIAALVDFSLSFSIFLPGSDLG